MAMILTYPTWVDPYQSYLLSYQERLSSPSNDEPVVLFFENPVDNTVTIRIEVKHDGRLFEVHEKHFSVDASKDREYFHRVVQRLADRLLKIVFNDEIERWINLTP
jgi:hypothetical protein